MNVLRIPNIGGVLRIWVCIGVLSLSLWLCGFTNFSDSLQFWSFSSRYLATFRFGPLSRHINCFRCFLLAFFQLFYSLGRLGTILEDFADAHRLPLASLCLRKLPIAMSYSQKGVHVLASAEASVISGIVARRAHEGCVDLCCRQAERFSCPFLVCFEGLRQELFEGVGVYLWVLLGLGQALQVACLNVPELLFENHFTLLDVHRVFDVALRLEVVFLPPIGARIRRGILMIGLLFSLNVVPGPFLEDEREALELLEEVDELWQFWIKHLMMVAIYYEFFAKCPIKHWIVNNKLVIAWFQERCKGIVRAAIFCSFVLGDWGAHTFGLID